jgi:branched-chain amino acid transport system substrate-binding protein
VRRFAAPRAPAARRCRPARVAVVTGLAAAVTAACGVSHASTASLLSGPSGRPITVGISLPLSGPAQAQGFEADGQACQRGYELWASDVNSHGGLLGRPVRLIIRNDRGWPGVTAADYRVLITRDHVDLTLAPFSSLLTAAAVPVTTKYRYALAAGSAGAPAVYALRSPDLFSTTVPVAVEMVPFARWVLRLPPGQRPGSAAYPMVSNPFTTPPVQRAQAILQAGGIRTVYSHAPYNNARPSALTADARQVAASGAQIVVLGSVDVPTVAAFVREFIRLHYQPKMFIAAAGPDQGQAFLNAVGPGNATGIMVPNGWFAGYPNPLSHVMVQEYIARYGGTASGINADVAESYSAGETLAAAVTATRSLSNAKIIAWLHHHQVQTVLGPVRFSGDGENIDAIHSAEIFQWQPGPTGEQFVQVLPKGAPGTVPIIASKPNWAG